VVVEAVVAPLPTLDILPNMAVAVGLVEAKLVPLVKLAALLYLVLAVEVAAVVVAVRTVVMVVFGVLILVVVKTTMGLAAALLRLVQLELTAPLDVAAAVAEVEVGHRVTQEPMVAQEGFQAEAEVGVAQATLRPVEEAVTVVLESSGFGHIK
jgi:hypothetical protein